MTIEKNYKGVADNLLPYSDEDLLSLPKDLENEINDLIDFFDSREVPYDNFGLEEWEPKDKKQIKAYPNYESYINVPGQHNRGKWLSALKELYFLEKNGSSRRDSINKITNSWDKREVFDFLNWIKFYEGMNHLKYKKAQNILNNPLPGYFYKFDPKPKDIRVSDIDSAISDSANSMSLSEKKRIIERQRHKIISRIDSAEKLLRTEEGNMFAGNELEALIESIYALKKKIQLVNKLSIATKLYEDMIIRSANALESRGFVKGAKHLKALAQNEPTLSPATPKPPTAVSGSPGGLPSMGPGMPQTPGMLTENNNPSVDKLSPGVQGFLNNLETGTFTTVNDLESVEKLIDENNVDLEVDEQYSDDEILVSEAQTVPREGASTPKTPAETVKSPISAPKPQAKPPQASQNILENKKDPDLDVLEETDGKKFNDAHIDQMLNSIFDNVTVDDVIEKLESLSKLFATRELSRQLALVDMMLDSLGLSIYFPGLSEAQNKSLESTNYISSRVDDVLAKLRGNLPTTDIDLSGSNLSEQSKNPKTQKIKENLENENEREAIRKQKRKDKENESLDNENTQDVPENKEDINIDVAKDLENNLNKGDVEKPAQPVKPVV